MRYYIVCALLSILWALVLYLAGSFVAAGFDLQHDWFGPGRAFAALLWLVPTVLCVWAAIDLAAKEQK